MRLNGKKVVNGIVGVLLLLLLSALASVNAYQVGATFRDCATCPEMVVLPSGKFMMGSPEGEGGRNIDEGPQHQVTIPKPFAVSKYEVTVGQYTEFVRETKHKAGNCDVPTGHFWRDPGFKQNNNHPVVCVSWHDAQAYVDWLSKKTGHEYRLLTEAEWEYAARAGTTTAYHSGRMILGDQANYGRNNEGTVEVGSFRSNAFGLHDMHGNVWEWVKDCWHDDYTGAPTNGSAWISGCRRGNENDCMGFSGNVYLYCKEHLLRGELHVLRGGSWYNHPPGLLRSAVRGRSVSPNRDFDYGFRVAQALTP